MGIITDISIPAEQFGIGPVLSEIDDTYVTFERVVPTGGQFLRFMWVTTTDHDLFADLLRSSTAVAGVTMESTEGTTRLYDISWDCDECQFLSCIQRTDATVLRVGGSPSTWEFELRFDDQRTVSVFQQACMDADISLSIDRVKTDCVSNPPGENLTQAQRETIELALREGYFDVPRQTTMVELADQLGISDQAVSARLRRAMKELSQQLLVPNVEQSEPSSKLKQ